MAAVQENLFDSASRFFKGLETSSNLREYLQQVDQKIQFAPTDGQAFHVSVSNGRVDIGAGAKYLEEAVDVLYITGDEASFAALLKGDISLAESIYYLKIQVAGYRNKEPRIAGFSKLLRLAVWDLTRGSRMLMPER